MRVIGYGIAAQEVYEQALLGGGCSGHLMRGSTEFSGRVFFPAGQKASREAHRHRRRMGGVRSSGGKGT